MDQLIFTLGIAINHLNAMFACGGRGEQSCAAAAFVKLIELHDLVVTLFYLLFGINRGSK